MRRILTLSAALVLALVSGTAQNRVPQSTVRPVERPETATPIDTVFFSLPDEVTDAYLDSAGTGYDRIINDYLLFGFHGGAVMNNALLNPLPSCGTKFIPHYPVFGASLTIHGKLFGFMPYFGLELGVQHTYEGFQFKEDKETGVINYSYEGAQSILIDVWEMPLLMAAHADLGETFKLLGKVGIYGGYRTKVERTGVYSEHSVLDLNDGTTYYPSDYTYSFRDFDYRWTYGLEGGFGFGIMLSPFEIHVNALVKWGMLSFFESDYVERFKGYISSDNEKYTIRRFANPFDVMLTAGIYYQLTPRRGYSRHQLKKFAKQIVYGE